MDWPRCFSSVCQFPQETLAAEARIARRYVGRLEKGVPSPTVTVLVKISNALEVLASVLIREMEGEGE
jgi:transcriptional regulator with XRE-family HTH domain